MLRDSRLARALDDDRSPAVISHEVREPFLGVLMHPALDPSVPPHWADDKVRRTELGNLRFRPETPQLRGEHMSRLPAKPAAMLEQLIRAAGDVVTDDVLARAIWGYTPGPTARRGVRDQVHLAIKRAAAAFEVKRVPKVGYRLHATDA